MEKYNEEVTYLDETSIEQLLQINKILHNAGVRRQAVLIYLFTTSPEREKEALKVMNRLQEENKTHFAMLDQAIKKAELKRYLSELLIHRENYTKQINKVVALKKAGQLTNALDDEETELEIHYETYIDYLKRLSDRLAANADKEIELALTDIKETRRYHNIIIVIGSVVLLIMIIGVLSIATRLRNDFIKLEKETAERKEAEKRLTLANKELEAKGVELNKLNKHKDKFISVISHDLRNPISSIIGSSSLLLDHPDEIEKKDAQRMIQIINKSSRNILQQLNELIALAQSAETKNFFNPVPFNLAEQVSGDIRLLWEIVEKKNIKIVNELKENVFIVADKFMFRSILQNLLTNALKYTPKGGKIVISSVTKAGMVEITISDSGVGIKEEERKHLFSGSFISKEGTEKEAGTGMGLRLVKDFIEKHSGSIKVESIEGKGTSVSFTLPLATMNG